MSLKMSSPSSFQTYMAQQPKVNRPRSTFDRSHSHTTAIADDVVVPIFRTEILPGDTIDLNMSSFVRMNPTLAPLMSNVWQDVHFFFVPWRLVWDNWQRFNGEQDDPGDSTDYLIPQVATTLGSPNVLNVPVGSVLDYMGLQVEKTAMETCNALYLRSYWKIANDWYRDQGTQNSYLVPRDDGPDLIGTDIANSCFVSNKKHDYFTSGLTSPQRGDAVAIFGDDVGLSGSAPVLGIGTSDGTGFNTGTSTAVRESGSTSTQTYSPFYSTGSGSLVVEGLTPGSAASYPNIRTALDNINVEFSASADNTISALTIAFQLQRLSELDNRGGTRYIEGVRAHWGVISPDARLQRSEYLGGFSSMVNMHPLAQTGESGTTPQGNLAGNGVIIDTGKRIVKSFTEHGCVLGLVRYRGDLIYSQGIPRDFSRSTRFDFFWPSLEMLPEQAVMKKELFAGGSVADNQAFSYMPRYDEYRWQNSYLTGMMRPAVANSLSYWHLGEELPNAMTLQEFIPSNTPFSRVLQVPTEPTFLCDFYYKFKHTRIMSTHAVPGVIGRL